MSLDVEALAKAQRALRSRPNTVVLFGDSLTNYYTNPGNALHHSSGSYALWAMVALKQRLSVVNEAGVDGNTTTQALARLDSDVISWRPGYVIVQLGVNDVIGGATAAQISDNLKTIAERVLAQGIMPVMCGIAPLSSTNTAQKAALFGANQAMKDHAIRHGYPFVDWFAHVADASSGDWRTGYSSDGTHPLTPAAVTMGMLVAEAMEPLIPEVDVMVSSNADPTNIFDNGLLVGSGGEGMAASLNAIANSATYTPTVVARDDVGGQWQQLDISVAASGNPLWMQTQQFSISSKISSGEPYYVLQEFELDDGFDGAVGVMALQEGAANSQGLASPFVGTSEKMGDFYPRSGVLKTKSVALESDATGIGVYRSAVGTGTVRWGRTWVRKGTSI